MDSELKRQIKKRKKNASILHDAINRAAEDNIIMDGHVSSNSRGRKRKRSATPKTRLTEEQKTLRRELREKDRLDKAFDSWRFGPPLANGKRPNWQLFESDKAKGVKSLYNPKTGMLRPKNAEPPLTKEEKAEAKRLKAFDTYVASEGFLNRGLFEGEGAIYDPDTGERLKTRKKKPTKKVTRHPKTGKTVKRQTRAVRAMHAKDAKTRKTAPGYKKSKHLRALEIYNRELGETDAWCIPTGEAEKAHLAAIKNRLAD
jgi:hypothetical protein